MTAEARGCYVMDATCVSKTDGGFVQAREREGDVSKDAKR